LAAEDEGLGAATLRLQPVQAELVCRECGAHTQVRTLTLECPSCKSVTTELTRGREILLTALELDDDV
jgi:Zn finger protein HypA/HybF involved in hydrogenase expression